MARRRVLHLRVLLHLVRRRAAAHRACPEQRSVGQRARHSALPAV
jgi:hypothetical protein